MHTESVCFKRTKEFHSAGPLLQKNTVVTFSAPANMCLLQLVSPPHLIFVWCYDTTHKDVHHNTQGQIMNALIKSPKQLHQISANYAQRELKVKMKKKIDKSSQKEPKWQNFALSYHSEYRGQESLS